jgi:hypothetical protein
VTHSDTDVAGRSYTSFSGHSCVESAHRVNAGEILQRLAGVKVHHGRKQEGPRYRGPSCLSRFIPEGQRPRAVLTGLGVTGAWSEQA